MLTRHPKLVLTTRGDRPRAENSFEKDCVSCMRGRSSAITQRIRTLDRLTPRARRVVIDVPRPRVHSSITPYEQNVSRTAQHNSLSHCLLCDIEICHSHIRLPTDTLHIYIGQRSFAVFGPATWNSLPPSLRAPELSLSTFKHLLKTQLFQHA